MLGAGEPALHAPSSEPELRASLLVIGHRGNSAHAPENTLESFRQAIALGVDGLEFDVRLSADGQLVVIHDPTVERTTNGTGVVSGLTLEQLRAFDAGYNFGAPRYPYRGRGVTIPTVVEALDLTAPLPLVIEIKALEAAEPLLALIQARHEEERVTIGSFVAGALLPFRKASMRTSASFDEVRALLAPAVCGLRRKSVPFNVLSIPPRYRRVPLPVRALARCLAPAGTPLHVWTVNDPAEALWLWKHGANAILTDDPATILEARHQARLSA